MMKAKDEMQRSIDNSDIGKFVKWLTDSGYKIVFEASGSSHLMRDVREQQNQHVLERYIKKIAHESRQIR